MKYLGIVILALLTVRGLNWLLIGALNFDLVITVSSGVATPLVKTTYIVAGIYVIYSIKFLTPLLHKP